MSTVVGVTIDCHVTIGGHKQRYLVQNVMDAESFATVRGTLLQNAKAGCAAAIDAALAEQDGAQTIAPPVVAADAVAQDAGADAEALAHAAATKAALEQVEPLPPRVVS